MKKTKIFLLGMLVSIFALFTTSCEKDFVDVDELKINEVEVQFNALNQFNDLKSDAFDIECSGEEVVSARIVIDGNEYNPLVMNVDGELLTQVIKLNSGTYTVESFMLLDASGNIVQATPASGSDFAVYVSETVPFDLVVPEFDKVERTVEVLCYTEAEYISFGFNWFNIGQVEVHQLLFFGDLCYDPSLFVGSLYDEVFDLSLYPFDIIALFEIHTFAWDDDINDWVELKVFSNVTNPNQPLVTEWFTHSAGVVNFKFELWVHTNSDMVFVHQFLFDSENPLTADTHNIVDFVIGGCVYTPSQFEFPEIEFENPDFFNPGDNPEPIFECLEWQTETAFAGDLEGGGDAWWYVFDGDGVQTVWAGQTINVGTVELVGGQLVITLIDDWQLQDVSDAVKIQGYNELPSSRPATGLFTTYKGNDLIVDVDEFAFYVIHLDVQHCIMSN